MTVSKPLRIAIDIFGSVLTCLLIVLLLFTIAAALCFQACALYSVHLGLGRDMWDVPWTIMSPTLKVCLETRCYVLPYHTGILTDITTVVSGDRNDILCCYLRGKAYDSIILSPLCHREEAEVGYLGGVSIYLAI